MSTCVHGAKPVVNSIVDDVLGPLTICTSDGAVTADTSGEQSHSKSGVHHCQSCTLIGVTALLLAAVMLALAPLVVPLGQLRPAPSRIVAIVLGPGGIRSRAPPTPA